MNVRSQVPVAQVEPVGAAVTSQAFQRMKSVTPNPPAFRWVNNSRQRVRHDVEIRRDFQPVKDDIVPSVDDDGQRLRLQHFIKPEKQFGCAHSTGKRRYVLAPDLLLFGWRHEMAEKHSNESSTGHRRRTETRKLEKRSPFSG